MYVFYIPKLFCTLSQARKLRAEIAQLDVERAEANRKLVSEQSKLCDHERGKRYDHYDYDHRSHRSCQAEVNRLRGIVDNFDYTRKSKKESLQRTLKAPPPVEQPLPQDKNDALPIIFFLYMPPGFQLLSRFSFTAQWLLIPKQPWDSVWGGSEGSSKSNLSSLITRNPTAFCQLSWKDYYNRHQRSQYHSPSRSRIGSEFDVKLHSLIDTIPEKIGNSNIDYIKTKNDGIWYPDSLRLVVTHQSCVTVLSF